MNSEIKDNNIEKPSPLKRIEEILKQKDQGDIKVDKAEVKIIEMKLDAIKKLAEQSNEIFSQIDKSEIFDVSRASLFADDPLPNLNQRLEQRGIKYKIKLPVIKEFITVNFVHRHKLGRKRVQEYLDALSTLRIGDTDRQIPEKTPLIHRLG